MTESVRCAITIEPEAWILRVIAEKCCRHATRVRFEPVDAYQPMDPGYPMVFYATWCHYYAQPKDRRTIPFVALMTHIDYLAWRVVAMTWRRHAHILCMSALYRRRLRYQGVPARKLALTPLGVDLELFTPDPGSAADSGKISVGLVGRIYPDGHKGEDLMEEIIRHLDPDRYSVCIVGSHWEPWLERLKDHPIEIRYHRMVDAAALPNLYRQMDALLIASQREGGPVTALEALACGIPVISRPVGYVTDLLEAIPRGGRIFRTAGEALAALKIARELKRALAGHQDHVREALEAYSWPAFTRHVEEAILGLHQRITGA